MRAIIVYASQSGQVEAVASRIESVLRSQGIAVDLYNVAEQAVEELSLDLYDVVVFSSTQCGGRVDARVEWCIQAYHEFLSEVPTAFVSICRGKSNSGENDPLLRLGWRPSMQTALQCGTRCVRHRIGERILLWLADCAGFPEEPVCDEAGTNWSSIDEFTRRFVRFAEDCEQPPLPHHRFSAWSTTPWHKYSVTAKHSHR